MLNCRMDTFFARILKLETIQEKEHNKVKKPAAVFDSSCIVLLKIQYKITLKIYRTNIERQVK